VEQGPEGRQGHGMPKKILCPRQLCGAGLGDALGAPILESPFHPATNSIFTLTAIGTN